MNYEEALDYFYNLKEKTTPFFSVENHDLLMYLLLVIFVNLIMISFSTLIVSIYEDDQQTKGYQKRREYQKKRKNYIHLYVNFYCHNCKYNNIVVRYGH